ncbi:MAG: hypothetical protein HY646_06710 [Acidobacteria bacterium]|nr:hypothetical protein [Acidobacteriota bacterium]
MKVSTLLTVVLLLCTASLEAQNYEYRLLATNRTGTMEKEVNETAQQGYRFQQAMGGDSAFGGKETIVIMSRQADAKDRYRYKLLATNKTSTMQKELQAAAQEGFVYRTQTVFDTTFGGKEVVVILERDMQEPVVKNDYRVLATNRTSTMEKELGQAGREGYELVGLTVAETAFGGKEVVAILRRAASGSN